MPTESGSLSFTTTPSCSGWIDVRGKNTSIGSSGAPLLLDDDEDASLEVDASLLLPGTLVVLLLVLVVSTGSPVDPVSPIGAGSLAHPEISPTQTQPRTMFAMLAALRSNDPRARGTSRSWTVFVWCLSLPP